LGAAIAAEAVARRSATESGVHKIARSLRVGTATVQRIKRDLARRAS
jgi:hypothetical protein